MVVVILLWICFIDLFILFAELIQNGLVLDKPILTGIGPGVQTYILFLVPMTILIGLIIYNHKKRKAPIRTTEHDPIMKGKKLNENSNLLKTSVFKNGIPYITEWTFGSDSKAISGEVYENGFFVRMATPEEIADINKSLRGTPAPGVTNNKRTNSAPVQYAGGAVTASSPAQASSRQQNRKMIYHEYNADWPQQQELQKPQTASTQQKQRDIAPNPPTEEQLAHQKALKTPGTLEWNESTKNYIKRLENSNFSPCQVYWFLTTGENGDPYSEIQYPPKNVMAIFDGLGQKDEIIRETALGTSEVANVLRGLRRTLFEPEDQALIEDLMNT